MVEKRKTMLLSLAAATNVLKIVAIKIPGEKRNFNINLNVGQQCLFKYEITVPMVLRFSIEH